jgi:uncharacterized protein YegL
MKTLSLICLTVAMVLSSIAFVTASPNFRTPPPFVNPGVSNYTPPAQIPGECDCIDLVLVIDVTGSMTNAINNVKAGIDDIIDLADSTCGNIQAALVTFDDEVDVDVDMTFNVNTVRNAVTTLSVTGGAFEPEASDEALREVLTEPGTICDKTGDFTTSAFRDTCCKVAILVTDAHPGGCDDIYNPAVDMPNAHARALEAAALGVRIGALYVPTSGGPGDIITVMSDYAATSGGVFGQADSTGAGTADAIEQIILDCAEEAATELCCIASDTSANCVEVLEGQCEELGGYVVTCCDQCRPSATEPCNWATIKEIFRSTSNE